MRSPADPAETHPADRARPRKGYASVLCPTDGSPVGDASVGLAYSLAAPGGVVHLLHVCEPTYVASPLDGTPVLAWPKTSEALETATRKARQRLREVVPGDALAREVRTEIHVEHDANPVVAIERTAASANADVVVMGTHGRTGVGRLLLGSVATDAMKRLRVPVVLFHPATAR
jgi:nucleotide-binding universal stress UspA family protein